MQAMTGNVYPTIKKLIEKEIAKIRLLYLSLVM